MIRTGSDSLSNTSTEMADEVISGLTASPKTLPSKYFYDEVGDKLFQEIMNLPEYYLTNCEFDILHTQVKEIVQPMLSKHQSFNIVELGAGDGIKTKVMLQYLTSIKADFTYVPIDISPHVLQILSANMLKDMPEMKIKTIAKTYFDSLSSPDWDQTKPTIMLFLGSSLGNFSLQDSPEMIKKISDSLKPGDQLLIGLDLQKDPEIILAAYNDSKGITREFNMNLLDRLNKELGANFNRDKFKHYPCYDPATGAAKSYIVSREQQTVHFKELNKSIEFSAGEAVFAEISQKYTIKDIENMANQCNFKVMKHHYDSKKYYVNSLWERQE